MIELKHDALVFSFPDVHPGASLAINFQRTLRIPDDDETYPLPPGLGRFPLRHVDDFAARLPASWIEHGGVMLPMHQAEALWIHFDAQHDPERETSYPFAVRIAAGKINAVTGQALDATASTRSPRTTSSPPSSRGSTASASRRARSASSSPCRSARATAPRSRSPARRSTAACRSWSTR